MAKKKASGTRADTLSEDASDVAKPAEDGTPTDNSVQAETDVSAEIAEMPDDALQESLEAEQSESSVIVEENEGEAGPTTDVEPVDLAEPDAEMDPEPEPIEVPAEPAPALQDAPQRKSGVMPMLLGGVIAAGIGFGAAYFVQQQSAPDTSVLQDVQAKLLEQSESLTSLSAKVDNIPAPDPVELSDLQAQIETTSQNWAALEGRIDAIQGTVTEMTARLTALEERPIASQVPDQPAVDAAALDAELAALRASLDSQKGELAQMMQEVEGERIAAVAAARAADAKSALSDIRTALEAGSPFTAELAAFSGTSDLDISAALQTAAQTGVITQALLQESLPSAARTALAAARDAEGTATGGGLTGFLSKQLNMRSVAPREGDDANAVLSRIEAATRAGDLETALMEFDALPDVAQAPLADWAAQASLRRDALRDAAVLASTLNSI